MGPGVVGWVLFCVSMGGGVGVAVIVSGAVRCVGGAALRWRLLIGDDREVGPTKLYEVRALVGGVSYRPGFMGLSRSSCSRSEAGLVLPIQRGASRWGSGGVPSVSGVTCTLSRAKTGRVGPPPGAA